MIRDFSDDVRQRLLSYCNDYEEWQNGDNPDCYWDSGYTEEEVNYYYDYKGDSEVAMQYIELHHHDLVFNSFYRASDIDEIFQKINELDDGLGTLLDTQTQLCYDPYIEAIQGLIDCLSSPAAGQSIMDDPSCFSEALDEVGDGALEDIVNQLDPETNGGDWGPLDELLDKEPGELSSLEMAAINQIMMDNVSLDENGNIIIDEDTAEFYEHFFEERGPFNHGYYPKPVVNDIVAYQQEYSQSVADRYAYVFNIPAGEMTELDEMRRDEVIIACAVSDMTYAVFSMSEWGDEMDKPPTFDITYDAQNHCIDIEHNYDGFLLDNESFSTTVYLYNSNVVDLYMDAEVDVYENELVSPEEAVASAANDEFMGLITDEIPVVSDVTGIVSSPASVLDAYNEAEEHNATVNHQIHTNQVAQYTEAIEASCSVVAEKDAITIRNVVIDTDRLEDKVAYINATYGTNFDSATLINEYTSFCNGGTDVPNLASFESYCNQVNSASF